MGEVATCMSLQHRGLFHRGTELCSRCGKRGRLTAPDNEVIIHGEKFLCCEQCIRDLEDEWADAVGLEVTE